MAEDDVEDALGRLRAALTIEPSVGFEERVRSRLAGRPSASPARGWLLAAAAAVLLALALSARAPRATAPVEQASSPAPAVLAPGPPERPTAVVAPVAQRLPAVHRHPGPVRSLVPDGGMERISRYVASVRARPLDPEVLARDASAALSEPPPIVIRAIEIVPLEISEGSVE